MQNDCENANNMWVFREGKRSVAGNTLRDEVERAAGCLLRGAVNSRLVINALLRAGEFEAALGDVDRHRLSAAESLTNVLAGCLWEDNLQESLRRLPDALSRLRSIPVPAQLHTSPPEGFAYYALHPTDFAALANDISGVRAAAVVGIRSIGTTLSAIAWAALRRRGTEAERMTVRPVGHPYDRVMRFTPEQQAWIAARRERGWEFLVADEGPGRSGSSFLSVAEALESAGVPTGSITLLGSRAINPHELCAADAPVRWSRFRFFWPAPKRYARFHRDLYIGGGEWRPALLKTDPSFWPACWPQMERFKFLSADHKAIYKFEGFGRFGEEVLNRARRLADAGFGPSPEFADDGMICYPLIEGEIAGGRDISRSILEQVADYCAFRAREFQVENAAPSQLAEMLQFNAQQALGVEPELNPSVFSPSCPVLTDGRMQLHEWIARNDGRLLKADGCTHGDDHFFPGPTDIAWDLAGTIVEWGLEKDATEFFLARYYRRTGDDATRRIQSFLLAYSVFRMAYCKMALSSVMGTPEHSRLQKAARLYRNIAIRQLKKSRSEQKSPVISNVTPSPVRLTTMKSGVEPAA